MQDDLEAIKDRSLVIAGDLGAKFRKEGGGYKARCILHTEDTPSLFYKQDEQVFHCFGRCGFHGDIFNLYAKCKMISNDQAIKELKERYGTPGAKRTDWKPAIKPVSNANIGRQGQESRRDIEERHRLYEALRLFCGEPDPESLEYLTGLKRGLRRETLKQFQIFSIKDYTETEKHLLTQASEAELRKAGLFNKQKKKNERTRLFFERHNLRIIIPVIEDGLIVNLRSRSLDTKGYYGLPGIAIGGKIFNSDILKTLQPGDQLFLCEGEFDTIALIQNTGHAGATGLFGASNFNEAMLKRLKDYKVKICLDNDPAGREQAEKIKEILKRIGAAEPEIISLPAGIKDLSELFIKRPAVTYGEAANKQLQEVFRAIREGSKESRLNTITPEEIEETITLFKEYKQSGQEVENAISKDYKSNWSLFTFIKDYDFMQYQLYKMQTDIIYTLQGIIHKIDPEIEADIFNDALKRGDDRELLGIAPTATFSWFSKKYNIQDGSGNTLIDLLNNWPPFYERGKNIIENADDIKTPGDFQRYWQQVSLLPIEYEKKEKTGMINLQSRLDKNMAKMPFFMSSGQKEFLTEDGKGIRTVIKTVDKTTGVKTGIFELYSRCGIWTRADFQKFITLFNFIDREKWTGSGKIVFKYTSTDLLKALKLDPNNGKNHIAVREFNDKLEKTYITAENIWKIKGDTGRVFRNYRVVSKTGRLEKERRIKYNYYTNELSPEYTDMTLENMSDGNFIYWREDLVEIKNDTAMRILLLLLTAGKYAGQRYDKTLDESFLKDTLYLTSDTNKAMQTLRNALKHLKTKGKIKKFNIKSRRLVIISSIKESRGKYTKKQQAAFNGLINRGIEKEQAGYLLREYTPEHIIYYLSSPKFNTTPGLLNMAIKKDYEGFSSKQQSLI